MAKNDNRDDFDKDTIIRAAKRVGFCCSFCNRITTAASLEGPDKVSNIGVASHICAASPGGPRYDKSMTPEERKSIENCIWLCQTHARLIDTDVITYPTEKLRKMKFDAEERSRKALEAGASSFEAIKQCGFDMVKTKEILDNCLANGDFAYLRELLASLKTSSQSEEFQDLYDYYKVVYSFYCDRRELESLLISYISKDIKKYLDNIVSLLISFCDTKYLPTIIDKCENQNLKFIATHILENNLEYFIIREEKLKDEKLADIKAKSKLIIGSALHRLITNYALDNRIVEIKNIEGENVPLYSDEFYYKQKIYLANLERKVFTYYTVREQHLTDYSEYNEFIKEIDKIKMLAPELQFNFWVKLLSTSSAINEREIYEKIVVDCNESLQNKFAIRRVILLNEIENNLKTVDFNEIRKLCDSNDDYSLLHAYINSINALKKGEAERIFNNYRYLLISDYLFLDDYIRIKQAKSKTNFSPVKFLLEYKSSYENSLGYHILLAFYYSNNKKYRNQFDSEAEWIKNNLDDFTAVPFVIVDKLVKVLYNAQQYEILVKLSNSSVPVLIRLQIANCLQEIKEYVITAIEIYESIKQFNSDIIGLNRCLSNCYYKLGDMTKAQNCLCEEIDLKCNSADLYNLFVLRLEIKDIKIDKYVDIAKEFVDSKLYHMIGIAYLQANKYEDAYQYLIKSLLLDDKNLDCLNTFMSLKNAQNGENQNQKNFEIGVTATLKNKAKNLKIALWSDVIIDGFKPIKLAGIINYKESDSAVEDILYCAVGDRIKYKDEEYEVISLDYTDTLIYGFAMRQLITSKRAYAIEGATIEESIQKLKEVLQERNEYIQNIVKAYNDSNGWLPITILSAKLGKNYLETYNFVYCENHKRIRNINAVGISSVPNKFLLSYDAVYLLAVLDIDTELIKQLNCKVSLATKNIMLHEVNELMNDCMNEKGVGQVILKDNNIYRIEKTNKDRVEQKKFLLRLKRIIDCIEVERKQYRYEYNDDFSDLFVTEKLQLEGDIIGCLKNSDDTTLVSDDAFIYTVSSFHRFNIIGINRFLILLNLGVKEHIEIIKRLSYLNFGNYITSDVYDDLKQKIISEKNTDKQKEFVELFYDLLTAKSMEVLGDKWKHNSILVRELVRTKEIDAHSADAFDKIAIHALVDNYAKEYPDEYKQRVEELEKKLRTKVYYKDGKICIESYFDDGEEDN